MFIMVLLIFFFFNDTATTEIYTLSLHDALPISRRGRRLRGRGDRAGGDRGGDGRPRRAGAGGHGVTAPERVRAGLAELAALAGRMAEQHAEAVAAIADRYAATLRAGGTLFFAGNGGSADRKSTR